MRHLIFKKYLGVLRVLVLVLLLGMIPLPHFKFAQATCGSVGPTANVNFNYIRNGRVLSYASSAGGFNPYNNTSTLTIDSGSQITNINYSLQAADETSYINFPFNQWAAFGPDSDTHYGGPTASNTMYSGGQAPYLNEFAGNSCGGQSAQVTVIFDIRPPDPTFTCSTSEFSATVDPGMSHTFIINTQSAYGFNSPITFSAPTFTASANPPTAGTYSNNNKIPPQNLAITINTTRFTTNKTYQVTFMGTGGGVTSGCAAFLIVNPIPPDFNLVISPSTTITPNGIGTNTSPNRSNIGVPVVFDVFADCTGPFAGPVTNITVTTTLTGLPTPALETNQLFCGQTTNLTVTHTELIPANQQSTPTNTILQAITVKGYGQF